MYRFNDFLSLPQPISPPPPTPSSLPPPRQYRMHPAIADFPSRHFYDGQVLSGTRASDRPTPRGFPWPTSRAPVALISVTEGRFQGGEGRGGRERGQLESRGGTEAAVQGGSPASAALGTSYCNLREAEAVAFALELLIAGGDVEVRDHFCSILVKMVA